MIDREMLQQQGYLIIPDLVPEALLKPAIDVITDFLEVDLSDSETWYHKDP